MVAQSLPSMCPSVAQVHHPRAQEGSVHSLKIAEQKKGGGVVMARKGIRQKPLIPPSRQKRPFLMAWA